MWGKSIAALMAPSFARELLFLHIGDLGLGRESFIFFMSTFVERSLTTPDIILVPVLLTSKSLLCFV